MQELRLRQGSIINYQEKQPAVFRTVGLRCLTLEQGSRLAAHAMRRISHTARQSRLCRARKQLILIGVLGLLATSTRAAVITQAWVQRYDGPRNYLDFPSAVAVDASGNVVVTGYSTGIGSNRDFYTAKYAAADGRVLWERRYNGPGNGDDSANAVAVDPSGNVIVTGGSQAIGFNTDYYTAKYAAADGALLWERRYDGPRHGTDLAEAVALDANGNVIVTGFSESGAYDYYTAKYAAADGGLLWERRYNGPANGDDSANSVAVDTSGNVVVTGFSLSSTFFGSRDYYTAKYAAADGALLWEQRYNGPAHGDDYANALAVDPRGNVIVTGVLSGTPVLDMYTAKYAASDGALLWEKHFPGGGNAVAVDASGDLIVTGITVGNSRSSDWDCYTAKYAAADGALLWERRYDGPAHGTDWAAAVVVDANGNVVVAGFSAGIGSGFDYYTAKYAASDGALLWEQRYNGSGNGNDWIEGYQKLAVGSNGTVAITGRSASDPTSETSFDFATILYRELMPPTIVTQPQNRLAECAVTNGFSVFATGDPPLSYEWFFNNTTSIDGGTNSSLAVVAGASTAGNYSVVVRNVAGSVTSVLATLTVADTTPPVITLNGPASISLECHTVFVDPGASAMDACAGSLPVTVSGAVNTNAPGSYTLMYVATDSSDNSATNTRTVIVVDATPPLLTCPPDLSWPVDPGQCSATGVSLGIAVATDPCGSISVSNNAPGDFPFGLTLVRWMATDKIGNATVCTQRVNVVERDPPVIVATPPAQLRARAGDTVTLTVGAKSCGPVLFQWCFGSEALPGETHATLALTNVQAARSGTYTAKVFNTAGTNLATVELRLNRPPVAEAVVAPPLVLSFGQTNLLILSRNGSNAAVVLDGSLSTDPDNDPLDYLWLADGSLSPAALSARSTNVFAVGVHFVTLIVDDGAGQTMDTVAFEVITAGQAVGGLILLLDKASIARRNKRPFLATLQAVMAAFDDGRSASALSQLRVFRNKARAQIAHLDAALADELSTAAQNIVDAFEGK
jgi:hypothetical protein